MGPMNDLIGQLSYIKGLQQCSFRAQQMKNSSVFKAFGVNLDSRGISAWIEINTKSPRFVLWKKQQKTFYVFVRIMIWIHPERLQYFYHWLTGVVPPSVDIKANEIQFVPI